MDVSELLTQLQSTMGEYLPGVVGALVVLVIGWLLAGGLRRITKRVLKSTNLDEKIMGNSQSGVSSEKLIGNLVYYLAMIVVLLVVLEMLGVSQVLDPLKNMLNEFLGFFPNLIAAGIIGFVGYIIAKVASELVNLTGNAVGRLSAKAGVSSNINLTDIVKRVIFILVFIPVLIVSLDTLQLHSIADPAKAMLGDFMDAIPNILAAVVIIGAFYMGGRFITSLLKDLLHSLGADTFSAKLKLGNILGENQQLSSLLASLAFFFVMFLGVMTGVEQLGFTQLTDILNDMFVMSGQIFFGLLVMILGNFLANIASKSLSQGQDGAFMASIARFAILGLFLAISLRTMGIANDIVNMAFGLTLGAIAVAAALAFGLGGREAGGKQMEYILSRFRKVDTANKKEAVREPSI